MSLLSLLIAPVAILETGLSQVFEYKADRPLNSVFLAGTFNNWNKGATPMTVEGDGLTWRRTLQLKPGKHLYKFVLNGTDWIVDPKAKRNEDDGNGHTNSVLVLVPADYARPAKAGDGIIAKSALRHTTTVPDLNWDRGKLTLSFRARPDDLTFVEMFMETPSGEKCVEFHEASRDEFYATYQTEVSWDRKKDFRYRLMLVDGGKRVYYRPDGLSEQPGKPFVVSAKTYKPFVVPGWVEKTVFYQIFPDRFANGDRTNDPADVLPESGKPTYSNRFGGDVTGIRQRLGHLASLGIGAVYFNPIFQSPSNHRYDSTDYLKVDQEFGTNEEFYELTKAMRAKGIRTVLDFAFNHTAVDFKPFLDVREKGERSAYKDWYFVKTYPVEVKENPPYEAWYGFPSMPKLNVMNPDAHAMVLGAVDFWRKNAGIDGVRLDVANEVDMRMWRDLRKHLKSSAPNVWILGEEWGDASPWLTGDQWDASMNYAFRDACVRFFAEGTIGSAEFAKRLMRNYALYVPQVSRNQFNLLSSHDTPRFLTLCKGDAQKASLAAILQFTWVGVPSIYYGEELGMQGGADPDNRRFMEWDLATPANSFLKLYRQLIAIRNGSRALQSGRPKILAADNANGTLVFARILDSDQAIVAVNRSPQAQKVAFTLPGSAKRFKELLRGGSHVAQKDVLTLTIPAFSAAILRPAESRSYHSLIRRNGVRRNS